MRRTRLAERQEGVHWPHDLGCENNAQAGLLMQSVRRGLLECASGKARFEAFHEAQTKRIGRQKATGRANTARAKSTGWSFWASRLTATLSQATPPARRRMTLPARTMRKRGSSCRCSSRMRRDSAPIPTISAQTWRTPVSRTSGAVQPADTKHKRNASGGRKQQDTPTQRQPSPQVGASGLQG